MNTPSTNFQIEDNHIFLHGIPELENRRGILIGEGIAMFFDGDSHEVYIANISTGKVRKLSTSSGRLLVEDHEIDYASISNECKHGIHNAHDKAIRYAGINRWGGFKDGIPSQRMFIRRP